MLFCCLFDGPVKIFWDVVHEFFFNFTNVDMTANKVVTLSYFNFFCHNAGKH